jgi:hypothetical protein
MWLKSPGKPGFFSMRSNRRLGGIQAEQSTILKKYQVLSYINLGAMKSGRYSAVRLSQGAR